MTARSRSSSSPARPTSSPRTSASSRSPTRSLDAAAAVGADSVEAALAAPAGSQTVAQLISDEAAIIGEKVELRRVRTLSGDKFEVYLHKTSKDLPPQVGVVLAYSGDDAETARSLAQHISFANPTYLTRDDVPDGRGREGARDRHRDLAQRGQARGRPAEDRRGPRQRVLQAGRAARPGLREGQQAVRRAGRQGRRTHPHGLRPLQGRRVAHAEKARIDSSMRAFSMRGRLAGSDSLIATRGSTRDQMRPPDAGASS